MPNPADRIQKKIKRRIHCDSRLDGSEIDVEINGEEVKLKGVVPSYSARRIAIEEARTAPEDRSKPH